MYANQLAVYLSLESRERLANVVKKARGSVSQRAYGKMLGVSGTTVRDWEEMLATPSTENLKKIAASAGYSLEDLLALLEGRATPQPSDVEQVITKIRYMPQKEFAQVVRAVGDRLAAVAEGQ